MAIKTTRQRLLGSSVLMATAIAIAAPLGAMALPGVALAQTAAPAVDTSQEVVVTGSILRRRNVDSESPLSVVTANDIEQRGQTTVQNIVQNLSNNGSGALPNNFSAGGAFAQGASSASLRGLTTNSTLVLIDGLRAAYYPLSDDGKRNFVDLNTIPSGIIDHIDVLKDGASSTYGADAIGGVINIITKKSFTGVNLKVEGGTSQQGGGDTRTISALVGHGNLDRDGYNFYLEGEYEHDDRLLYNQRDFPYNTSNLSSMCAPSIAAAGAANTVNGVTCRANGVVNGLQFNNAFTGVGTNFVPVVRPYNAANTAAQGDFRLLNPTAGCPSPSNAITITPAEATLGGAAGISAPVNLCTTDTRALYNVISPEYDRASFSGRFTKRFNNGAQFYAMFNYYQDDVQTAGAPAAFRGTTTPTALGSVSFSTLALPVYVCPNYSFSTTTQLFSCPAGSGTLNPNNPYAANNQVARLYYSFGDIPNTTEDLSQTYRFASGLNGTFDALGGSNRYSLELTGMQSDLKRDFHGAIYLPGLLNAIGTGSYNFVTPSQNTAAVRNSISPVVEQLSRSNLAEASATISRDLFHLWAADPVQLGLGVSTRYESLNNPSASPDQGGNPYNHFFGINPFFAVGSRSVNSADFEVDIPVIKQFDLDVSGRYDRYSTGADHFSPKIGGKFKPIDWLTLRSTYSEGFRIPSFAETGGQITGSVPSNAPAAFQALHGNDGYGQSYSLGRTAVGSNSLQPETSTNFNVGFVIEPNRHINFSIDFYRIKKKDVVDIDQTYTNAIANYFTTGQLTYQGHTIILAPVDPNYPTAPALPLSVTTNYVNADSLTSSGYDFAFSASYDLPWGIHWRSNGDATYVLRLNEVEGGSTYRFAGTLGPSDPTAGSGTPKWRATWQNGFSKGPFNVSATVYYTSGYSSAAEDAGDTSTDCNGSVYSGKYRDGKTPIVCNVKSFIDVDLHASYQLNHRLQFYVDVQNLFDKAAPLDATAYGGGSPYLYNPAWASAGVIGRYFKVGAKATF